MSKDNQPNEIMGLSYGAFLWFALFFGCIITWSIKPELFIVPWMKYSLLKIWIIEQTVGIVSNNIEGEAIHLSQWLNNKRPDFVSFKDFVVINSFTFRYFGSVLPLILIIMMIKPILRNKYNKKHDIESLILQEMHYHTHLLPFAFNDPNNEKDINKGDFAKRSTPKFYAKNLKLIKKGHLLKEKTQKVIISQLGKRFDSIQTFSDIELFFAAVFSLHISKKDKQVNLMIRKMNYAFSDSKGFNKQKGLKALKKDREIHLSVVNDCQSENCHNHHVIEKRLRSHGYNRTMLQGLLFDAKKEGIICHTSFPWLKAVDRILHYVVSDGLFGLDNKLVLRGCSVEQIGVRAHFLAEYKIGRKLETPYIETAISGLSKTLKG